MWDCICAADSQDTHVARHDTEVVLIRFMILVVGTLSENNKADIDALTVAASVKSG